MFNKLITTLLVSCVLATSGCAVFKSNKLETINADALNSEPANKTPVKVFSRWNLSPKTPAVNEQAKIAMGAVHKKNFEDALSRSSCCVVVESLNEANIVVDGTIYNENSMAAIIPAMITGFSLFTIPSWATAKIHISAEIKSDKVSKSYDLADSITMVQWLPMIFVMPFTGTPIKAENQMNANTYNTLVVKMKGDGFFQLAN